MTSKVKIPKLIMQTWKTHNVPEHWKSSPSSIKKYMPDWKYVLIDDDKAGEIVEKYFPDFADKYYSFEYPIMRVDAFRYIWMYLYGGVYMDLDIEITHSLEDLFYEDADFYVVESGNVGSIYTNSFIASKPGCKIWLDCIEEMKKPYKYWQYGKHLKVMGTTGPLMLTQVINRNKYKYQPGFIPQKLVMPCSICDPKPCTKKGAYTKALEGSSWCGWDSLFYNTCVCNLRKILLIILLIILLLTSYYFDLFKYLM